jgi:hypothetical protein
MTPLQLVTELDQALAQGVPGFQVHVADLLRDQFLECQFSDPGMS